jgi:transposase InsO family protein
LHDALFPKPARLLTAKVAVGQSDFFEALIDGGSQLNLVSAELAKEHDLPITPLSRVLAEGVDGRKLKVYGTTETSVRIVDSRGKEQTQDVPFLVTDAPKYQMYLGLPWIDACQPKISYATRRILFRGTKARDRPVYRKIALEEAEDFEKTMRDPKADVYGCLVASVVQSGPDRADEAGLPPQYSEFAQLGSEDDSRILADHGPQDLAINLVPGAAPPHQPLYSLSRTELELLRKYLDEYLSRGWIRHSKSPAGAPILFAKKKDGSMRLCVDYRGLNKVTVKNRHPLPLITESLDRLASARYYTKLDVKEAYHRIRIHEGDEWKTAFRTRYGHFEYTVMPFGLTNAPAQFQAYIHQVLAGLVDITCIVYLDDILIFSGTEEEHVEHVKEVLRRLRKAKLYLKLPKCEWHTQRTEYLGYIVSPDGISVDPDRVKTIQEWPEPRTVREIRVFIGFMNYYRRFISGFSKLALPLTVLTQKGPGAARGGHTQRKEESQALDIGQKGREAFQKLKNAFLGVPILAHFERDRKTRAEVDASGGAIAGILSQFVPDQAGKGQWRPIDFFSRKLIAAEYNYDTHDQELLAIVKSLEHWRQYLEGVHFELLTDHQNLKWFMETKTLNHRQVRSYLVLSEFDFVITHRPGATNPADGPSRRPDYMAEAQKPTQKYNEAFVQPMRDLLQHGGDSSLLVAAVTTRASDRTKEQTALKEALAKFRKADRDHFHEPWIEEERGLTDIDSDDTSDESELEPDVVGLSQATKSRVAPATPKTVEDKARALQECHDDPLSGHFGARRTLEKLQRHYSWKGMRKDVEEYCKDCLICRRSTAVRHRPYGPLAPLPIPTRAWEEVTMDFITELPPSKYAGVVYDAILVVVCRLTKMAHYIPARGVWDGTDLAQAWIREIIRLHGVPVRIISDRGPLMNSKHWDTFLHYLNARRVLSSAYHPQTDGQTERQNQTLEQYLRCYCALEQDDWAVWISIGEFAYNDSVHSTTGVTPFRAYYGMNPRSADWPEMALGVGESPMAHQVAAKVIELQQECRKKIEVANAYQKAYADKRRTSIPFSKGDQVLVSNRHIRSTRPKKKLDWKFLGPGRIVDQIGPSAFKVDLPGLKNVHPVFHASLLEPYNPSGLIPHPEAPTHDTLREFGDDVYEVEEILDRKQNEDDQWIYLIKWAGYPDEENSWEVGANISAEALRKFWNRKGIQQRRKPGQPQPVKRGRGRPRKERG